MPGHRSDYIRTRFSVLTWAGQWWSHRRRKCRTKSPGIKTSPGTACKTPGPPSWLGTPSSKEKCALYTVLFSRGRNYIQIKLWIIWQSSFSGSVLILLYLHCWGTIHIITRIQNLPFVLVHTTDPNHLQLLQRQRLRFLLLQLIVFNSKLNVFSLFTWETNRRHFLLLREIKRFTRLDECNVILISFILYIKRVYLDWICLVNICRVQVYLCLSDRLIKCKTYRFIQIQFTSSLFLS